jgi:TonB family protein
VLTPEGNVKRATLLKSSGNPKLDQAAREAVLNWKMKAAAVKPADLSRGRDEIIEFRQEPILVARYQDRDAYFESKGGIIKENELSKMWLSAPFPSYPYDARLHWEQGTVLVTLTIGNEGTPQDVHVFKGSGHLSLDYAAVQAVKLWRARKEYIGRKITFPITFKMGRRQ